MQRSVFFCDVMWRILNRLNIQLIVSGVMSYCLLSIPYVLANDLVLEKNLEDKFKSNVVQNVQAYLGHSSFIVLIDVEMQNLVTQGYPGVAEFSPADMFNSPDDSASAFDIKSIRVSLVIDLYVTTQQEQYLSSLVKESIKFSAKRGDSMTVTRKSLNALSIERWIYENTDFLSYTSIIFLLLVSLLFMSRRVLRIENRSKDADKGSPEQNVSQSNVLHKTGIQNTVKDKEAVETVKDLSLSGSVINADDSVDRVITIDNLQEESEGEEYIVDDIDNALSTTDHLNTDVPAESDVEQTDIVIQDTEIVEDLLPAHIITDDIDNAMSTTDHLTTDLPAESDVEQTDIVIQDAEIVEDLLSGSNPVFPNDIETPDTPEEKPQVPVFKPSNKKLSGNVY